MASLPVTLSVRNSGIKLQDVLLGKGGPSACHIGTVAIKTIIEARLGTYLEAKSLTNGGKTNAKTLITLQVVTSVQLAGGRFLATKDQVGSNSHQWDVLTNTEARIRVRELFREFIKNQTRKHRYPCALLNKAGLSGLFTKNATFEEVVLHIAASANIQSLLRTRNNMREKREQKNASINAK